MASGATQPDNSANLQSTPVGNSTDKRLANLRPPWPKGTSGNPNGSRPKPITKALNKLLKRDADAPLVARTIAEKIAIGQIERAIAKDLPSVEFITDRVEGKTEPSDGEQQGSKTPIVNLILNIPRPRREVSEKAADEHAG